MKLHNVSLSFLKYLDIIYLNYDSVKNSSSIYNYGLVGSKIKAKIESSWKKYFIDSTAGIMVESSILTPKKILEDSGHLKYFNPSINSKEPGLFKIESEEIYLRPETAQGIFQLFKFYSYLYNRNPLIVGQKGKSFRSEKSSNKTPFKSFEFTQLELEVLVNESKPYAGFVFDPEILIPEEFDSSKTISLESFYEKTGSKIFTFLLGKTYNFMSIFGFKWRIYKIPDSDLPHYSKVSYDVEVLFNGVNIEVATISNRGNSDLKNVFVKESSLDVIEFSFGLDRLLVLFSYSFFIEKNPNYVLRPFDIIIIFQNTSISINKTIEQLQKYILNNTYHIIYNNKNFKKNIDSIKKYQPEKIFKVYETGNCHCLNYNLLKIADFKLLF